MDQATQLRTLQLYLRGTGRYAGAIDGDYGPKSREGVLAAMHDGPDTALAMQDYLDSAGRLGCHPANIMAFASVEAAGAGFQDGFPKLLFEPHIFCRLTQGRFSGNHPSISYAKWGARPYPSAMGDRYAQLLEAVGLDVTAGFSSASYGRFQIMGANYAACGYDSPTAFAFAQAYDERTQLKCFEAFIRSSGLLKALQGGNWVALAKCYNGPAYANNRYDVRLAQAARVFEQQLEAQA